MNTAPKVSDPQGHESRPPGPDARLTLITPEGSLIVPAVMSLMGRWNWWLPNWGAKLLRVEPSTLRPAEART
ncbi:MAG TPA: hypothetical protein VD766_07305 [Solirubrobacterales bacterium]|nr:hypothetical protein [Solirubrobacterales bacterium]